MLPLLFSSPLLSPTATSMNISPPHMHLHAHKSYLNFPELSQNPKSALPDPTAVSTMLSSPAPQGFLQPLQMQRVPLSRVLLHMLLPLLAMPWLPFPLLMLPPSDLGIISLGKSSSSPSLGQSPLLHVLLEPGSFPQRFSSLIIIMLCRVWLFYLGLHPSLPAARRGDHGE